MVDIEMRYKELKCNVSKEIAEVFTDFLDSIQPEGYYEVLFDSSLPKKEGEGIIRDDTNINVYLGEDDLEKELKIHIFLKTKIYDFFIESRVVETREFEEAYKEFYKPFAVGEKFVLIPTWEKDSEQGRELLKGLKDSIPLYMNPGLAFGTGHHETTKLMLSRMPNLIKPGMDILDMGTGSGILSIGAGLLGAKFILAIDIDPNAVRASEYNWSENQFPAETQFFLKEGGFDHPEIENYSFDLVLANITYAVISQNIERIAKIKSKHFLFSGIISEREKDSLDLFAKYIPGELLFLKEFNEWLVIEWKRV